MKTEKDADVILNQPDSPSQEAHQDNDTLQEKEMTHTEEIVENTPSLVGEESPSNHDEVLNVNFDLLDVEGRWLLKVISGPNAGAEFAMQANSTYTIGTDTKECDVILQDLSVSRKHLSITIDANNQALLTDLQSKNGTFVEHEKITSMPLTNNTVVTIGTTVFVILDRESDQTTIITAIPLEPIAPPAEEKAPPAVEEVHQAVLEPMQTEVERIKEAEIQRAKSAHAISSLVMLTAITGLIFSVTIGGAMLFRAEQVTAPTVAQPESVIAKTLSLFPAIRFSYNTTNQRLLLIGHVSSLTDRSKLLDVLQQLPFIREVEASNVVIDTLVCQEMNVVLSKNTLWKSITVTSPTAGRYVISGVLASKEQANDLFDYMNHNFVYMDLLERKVVIEEELLNQILQNCIDAGFRGVVPTVSGGDLQLVGNIPAGTMESFQKLVDLFRSLPGVRTVELNVTQAGQQETYVPLKNYRVTGISRRKGTTSIVINGKILSQGDIIDGMTITSISPSVALLEKNGVKYKIDLE